MSDLYLEITDNGDYLRLEPLHKIEYNSQYDSDNNWIKTKVNVKGGVFSGEYFADLLTTDFELLKRDVKKLDMDFNAIIAFQPLERQLVFKIKGDGLGHFVVACEACPSPYEGQTLSFSLSFDQTELKRLFNELDSITKAFPISGGMNITNE